MKTRHAFAAALAIVMILALPPVRGFAAEDDTLIKRIEGVEAVDGEYNVECDEEIEENGVKYILQSVEYEQEEVERKVLTQESERIYTDEYVNPDTMETETFVSEVEDFPQTIEKDGTKFVLKDVKESRVQTETGRTVTYTMVVKRSQTRIGDAAAEAHPDSYIDPATGLTKLTEDDGQMMQLVSSEKVDEYWSAGAFTTSMRFNHYEYLVFDFQGVELPKNEQRPMDPQNYYLVLQYLGLSGQYYRITDISWAGAPFTVDGTTYRDAAVTGDIYDIMYDDTYEGTIEIPDISYTVKTAEYEEDQTSYESRITATAILTYVRAEEEETTTAKPSEEILGDQEEETGYPEDLPARNGFIEFLTSTPGIFLLSAVGALAIAGVIFGVAASSKKKKKKEEQKKEEEKPEEEKKD